MGIPKYKLIYSQIIRLILINEWPIGSFMKSENQLIEFFKVSRLTIRNVLSILENEGRIKKSQGRKTVILDRRLGHKANSDSELKDRSGDLYMKYNIIDFKIIPNHLKHKFTSSKSLYFIERTRGDKKNHIYLISRAYISKELVGTINKQHVVRNKNLLDLLMIVSKLTLKKSTQELKAIHLNLIDVKIFKSIVGMPAISNTWYFYDDNDNLVLIDEEITIEPLKVVNNYN